MGQNDDVETTDHSDFSGGGIGDTHTFDSSHLGSEAPVDPQFGLSLDADGLHLIETDTRTLADGHTEITQAGLTFSDTHVGLDMAYAKDGDAVALDLDSAKSGEFGALTVVHDGQDATEGAQLSVASDSSGAHTAFSFEQDPHGHSAMDTTVHPSVPEAVQSFSATDLAGSPVSDPLPAPGPPEAPHADVAPPEIPPAYPTHEHFEPAAVPVFAVPEVHVGHSFFESVVTWVDDLIRTIEHSSQVFLADLQEHIHPHHVPATGHATYSDSHETVVGTPAEDMRHWELQDKTDTCAVVSQKYVIEEMTGRHLTQDEAVQRAQELNLYHPGQGTAPDDVGKLLESYGIHTETEHHATMKEMEAALANHEKVLVAVNGDAIWYSGSKHEEDLPLLQCFGTPPGSMANHCVQVIGVEENHPGGAMVILNDPGTPDGKGLMIPLKDFEASWGASNNFMVNTVGAPSPWQVA